MQAMIFWNLKIRRTLKHFQNGFSFDSKSLSGYKFYK